MVKTDFIVNETWKLFWMKDIVMLTKGHGEEISSSSQCR